MSVEKKDQLVAVSYRIRPAVRAWLAAEAAEKHDRPTVWLVNKILEEAYAKAQQQPHVGEGPNDLRN
jgi:hypothetical protein